ncbi:MAG TPA: hypothetical protein VGH15_05725 [Caulobacteraceae bacterium]|jgi:hypothetical protein
MIAVFGGKRVRVGSLAEASRTYCTYWDDLARRTGRVVRGGTVVDDQGREVGRISQNGRVWAPSETWSPDTPLLCEAQRS